MRRTLETLTARLLDARNAAGHWEGRLSSSALSTATALTTLALKGARPDLVDRGIAWLVRTQNPDGGWGDTTKSISNISTTALCWAAFGAAKADERESDAVRRVEAWLRAKAGSLEPASLAAAITARYGKDRTFSVPILTMLALSGRLGQGRLGHDREAWKQVWQLPFELSVAPHQLYQWLRLPVVSYALPALIAIGQVRHHHRPTRNPLTRALRAAAIEPSLRLLREIQPETGGYLEATPLTSFVSMSLISAGRADHPVVEHGVRFLIDSARADGSWPIDTNLATWVTTLSVNALALVPDAAIPERERITEWLLAQQYRVEHPYTHAAPGGWAWTDLAGGVPDADDTPGALCALHHLAAEDPRALAAAESGIRWLRGLQNSDGGIPTFCRGWANLPFDRSSPDLTAHTLLAFHAWLPKLADPAPVRASMRRALDYLRRVQRPDGEWAPLWFGNQFAPDDENLVYGTSRVLIALSKFPEASDTVERAAAWLRRVRNADGGWGGAAGVEPSIEETALAVHALAACGDRASARLGAEWLVRVTREGAETPASPVGFYFAKLWYFEELYPLIFATAALGAVSTGAASSV